MDTGLYKSVVWIHALVGAFARREITRDELFCVQAWSPVCSATRARISLRDWHALVRRAMLLTQDSGLGIAIRSTVSDNVHQLVTQIVLACGSLREAMRMFERYRPLMGNAHHSPRHYLDERQLRANAAVLEMLSEGAERLLAEQGAPSLPDQVRAMLRHEVNLRHVEANYVAQLLKLDTCTFLRRLIQTDTSWSQLLDEARRDVACHELRRGDISIRQLVVQLGFSDQSAFNRAFKRWTGTTPGKFCKNATGILPANHAFSLIGATDTCW